MTAPAPDASAPSPRRAAGTGQRLVTATAVVALVGVLVALLGIVLATRPLRTPTQDCGTAASFLLRGGVDELVNPDDPTPGTTAAEARDNNARPCQERAAARARPAGALVVGGVAVALVSLSIESAVRFGRSRRRRRAQPGPGGGPV